MDLLKKIVDRDLAGSYYIELQHRGEPLLNNKLEEIIDLLSPHVFLGLSTNGSLIHKHIDALLKLDYITISTDAAEKELYEKLRKGGKWETFIENIQMILDARGDAPTPIIDLQLIELDGEERHYDKLVELVKEKGWDVTLRTLSDCFIEVNHPDKYKVINNELCLNPFMSVSIHANGNVAACCRVWEEEVIYGNLNDNSLEEIWNDNPIIEEFRTAHRTNEGLPYMCTSCFLRSPVMMHMEIYRRTMNDILHRRDLQRKMEMKTSSQLTGTNYEGNTGIVK